MSDAVVRLTGRPKIDRDSSGLRRITRTYIVQGSAVTEGNVESQVFLPYGTPDVEYDATITQDLTNGGLTNSEVTGAYLVEQSITPGQSMNEAGLTRVYQELDASNEPVQIGSEKIVRGAQDRLTVTKVFIVKNPHESHYSSGRIGVATINVAGSICYLGTIQSEKNEVFTQFTEVYFEDGVLSESVSYKYGQYPNHRLEVRTLRSVVDIPSPPSTEGPGTGTWFRVDEKEGPGNQDFGQLGKTVQTVVFAKGEGLLSQDAEVKGKPPNTVEVTTVKYITGENGTVPAANIPNFTRRTFEGKEEKDGWELHTIRGVVVNTDNGVVDVDVQYKHGQKPNHKLEIAKAISYGIAPDAQDVLSFVYPNGDNSNLGAYVLVTERENTTGEYDVFTSTFARGNGTISETEKKVGFAIVTETVSLHPPTPALPITIQPGELTRKVELLDGYQKLTASTTTEDSGLVEDKTDTKNNGALVIKTLMQLGTVWDATNTPADFVEISVRKHRYDIYPAITKVFAKGVGLISTTKRKEGLATIVETVRLFPHTTFVDTNLQANELKRKVDEKDGYKILSVSTTDQALTLIDNKEEEFHNGSLTIISRTSLGDTWNAANTPYGYVEVSHRDHTYKEYAAVTKKFAKGDGSIQVGEREEGLFTIQTHVILGTSNPPAEAVNLVTTEEQGYQKTKYELKVANLTKEDFKSNYSSGIFSTTRSKINHNYPTLDAAGGRSIKWLDGRNYIGSATDIEPTLSKEVSKSFGGGVKRISTTEIGKTSANSYADGGAVVQLAVDVFRNTTISVDKAHLSSQDTTYGSGIKTVRETTIDSSAKALGNSGGSSEQIGNVIFKNATKNISPSIYTDRNINYGGGVKKETQTFISSSSQSVGNSGGRVEQLASNIFRITSVTVGPSYYEDESVSYGGGVKRISKTNIGPQGSLGNSGGKIEQIADDIFRNTEVDVEAAVYKDKNITYSRGVVRTTETTIDSSSQDFGNSGGKNEQLADDIFRNSKTEIEAAQYSDISVSYATGKKRTSTTSISDSPVIPPPNVGGVSEQIAEDVFRNVAIEETSAAYLQKDVSNSKWYKLTTERKASSSPSIINNLGGGYTQIGGDLYLNTEASIVASDDEDQVTDFIGSGAVKVEKFTSVAGGLGDNESSKVHVHPEVDPVETRTEYKLGELAGESVTLENGISKVTTTTSVVQVPAMSGAFGSTTQIVKDFYVKKTKAYELWNEIDGQIISDRTYHRLGVEFNEIVAWGQKVAAKGTEVSHKKETIIVPQGTASTTLDKHTTTGATFKTKTWYTYEVRNFSCPGVIDRQKEGVIEIPPKTTPLWCKIKHQLVQNPGSSALSYIQPSASLSMTVGFRDRVKDYSFTGGGGNYVSKGFSKAVPIDGDKFQGSTVLFCDLEKDGTPYTSWNPFNKVFTSSTDLIYTANGFDVYHQQEVSANAKPVL
jgi:hypothetical protein